MGYGEKYLDFQYPNGTCPVTADGIHEHIFYKMYSMLSRTVYLAMVQ
jgi:hypothetical protein